MRQHEIQSDLYSMKLMFVSVTESQAPAPAIIQKEQFNNQQIFFGVAEPLYFWRLQLTLSKILRLQLRVNFKRQLIKNL